MKSPASRRRVMVLGMDGLDPRRVTALIDQGHLPSFTRLHREGRLGALGTSNPAESPVAWSSLATGCNPGQHGVFDFLHRDPRQYVPRLSLFPEAPKAAWSGGGSRFIAARRRPGFWTFTSDAGVPTTVIRWPVTFPAEPVTGRFLAGLGVPDVCGRLGRHTLYTTENSSNDSEKVVAVAWKNNRIRTALLGPAMGGLARSRPVKHPLSLERLNGQIVINVGSQRQRLAVGQWSDWFSVCFKWGPLHICDAIVKFRLVQLEPQLKLFATPLQIDPARQPWPLTEPAGYGAELADALGTFYTLGLPEDTHAVTEGYYDLDAFLQQCDEIGRTRRRHFEYELNRFQDGVFAFVFDSGDRIQHLFWCVDDPQSPTFDPHRAHKYGHVVPDLYREMDELVGAALDALDPEDALFVVSDHGFAAFHRAVHLNRWLIERGYMTLRRPGEGRSLLEDVDFSKTCAYAVGFTSLYLNLAGRERDGFIRAGSEADSLIRRLAEDLRAFRDPRTGERIIREVYDTRSLYAGPQTEQAPDLVVGFEPGYRVSWQTALGGAPLDLVVDNDKLWSADHLVDPSTVPGILATNVRIRASEPDGVDLAPTVLNCLDLPVPEGLDGTSWLSDSPGGERDGGTRSDRGNAGAVVAVASSPTDGLTDEQRSELENHLSDLGYL